MESRSVTDFYTEIVLPRLQERLDRAFPEFGWKPDRLGWVATDEEHTHTSLGVRAERVVAHGPAPRGFLIHGGEPMLWTAYVNEGVIPRGIDFVRAVRDIGERAGVDLTTLDRAEPRDRRSELLRDFADLCQRELVGEKGRVGRAYLGRRGLPTEAIETSGLGLVPASRRTHEVLTRAGYEEAEVIAAGVLADSRWAGRLCGAWRDENGRVGTLWARTLSQSEAAETRYLYLRGASRSSLPPYGLSDVLAGSRELRRELLLVEGVMDLHQLRAHGIENIAALGGLGIQPKTFERLARLGVERVTLCFDRDEPGRAAIARAVEQSTRAEQSPAIFVIDPERLGSAKDPDSFVRDLGPARWLQLLETRRCGIAWRAHELAGAVRHGSPASDRRAALASAGRWLGTLPPRLALEQEDAIRVIAEQCGYSSEAVSRSFRARFWSCERRPARSPTDERVLGLER